MDTLLQIFFSPIRPFVWHSERAYLMAGGFAVLFGISVFRAGGFKPRIHILILAAVLLWILFGLNEYQAKQKGWDIRVDLLFFGPVLLVVSVASAWRGVRSIVTGRSKEELTDNTPKPSA